MKLTEHKDYGHGILDCAIGIPHKDKSEAYNAGYAWQYEKEQIDDYNSGLHLIEDDNYVY